MNPFKSLLSALTPKQRLQQAIENTMMYCDGCGEDYPQTHLVYMSMFDGTFCERCAKLEDDAY